MHLLHILFNYLAVFLDLVEAQAHEMRGDLPEFAFRFTPPMHHIKGLLRCLMILPLTAQCLRACRHPHIVGRGIEGAGHDLHGAEPLMLILCF